MRVPEVERTVLRQSVLTANRQPQTISVGQSCGAVSIVDRRLIIREAHLDRPGIVVAMDRTDADTPGVLEVLRSGIERLARVAHDLQLLDLRPAGPGYISEQGPLLIQFMLQSHRCRIGDLDVELHVSIEIS